MSFRLWTIFYVFALLAAAMATFGPLGITIAAVVIVFWSYCWKYGYPKIRVWYWVIACALVVIACASLIPVVQSPRGIVSRDHQ